MRRINLMMAALVVALPMSAFAGTYTAAVTGAPGSTVTLNVQFAGDGTTAESQTDLDFSNTNITITAPVAAVGGSTCLIVNPTKIRAILPSTGNPLSNTNTTYCTFSVAIAPAAPTGLIPFTVQPGDLICASALGDIQPCTLAAGAGVDVQNTPVPRTLAFNPTAGSTITFAAGAAVGAAAPNQNIAVTATGTTGTPTVSGCAITGAGAANFSVAPTSLSFPSSNTQNLVVGCNYPAVSATATLTCNETDADSTNVARAFTLSCPAPTVNPTIAAAPPSGSTISLAGGIAGTQSISTIDFSATGGSGAGSTAISCTSTGNVQIANAPATPAGQGPVNQTVTGSNQPVDLRVGVTLTTTAQSPAGTVTCTAAGQAPFTYNVNAPAGTTVVPPTFIPSSSTWSILALLSLMGMFGLVAVGFRRQS